MNEPRHDDERLAALLDGRLEGPERDELLAYLAAAGEDYEVLVDTAAILREAEEDEIAQAIEAGNGANPLPPEVVPPSVRKPAARWPRRRALRWIATFVVLAGLVVLGRVAWTGRQAPAAGVVQLAARVAQPGEGLPDRWEASSPGISARGGEADVGSPGDAARAGALLLRLGVAIQAGDAEDTRLLSLQVQEIFDQNGGLDLKQIEARAGEPADSLAPLLQRATARLETLFDPDHLRLGAWVEAARIAAYQRKKAFFHAGDTPATLQKAEQLIAGDPGAQGAVQRIRGAIATAGGPDWAVLTTDLERLQHALTN